MKLTIVLAAVSGYLMLLLVGNPPSPVAASSATLKARVPEKEYLLNKGSKDADNKEVFFNHDTHSTKNYSIDGTKLIDCVECHHTDQPKAALKPPLLSAVPPDRTTTLTTDLLAKDAKAPDIDTCRSCHAQKGGKPTAWPEMPTVTYEGESEKVVMDNEQAYHRNCNVCHDQALEKRSGLKIPGSSDCSDCHSTKKRP